MQNEYISRNLKVPFIIVQKGGKKCYLCENGVLFTDEEYKAGVDLNVEYERRSKNSELYDFEYAKSTGILRVKEKKTVTVKQEDSATEPIISEITTAVAPISRSTKVICALLAFTSVISMYISTLHTATYLMDYVGVFSAWLMSASVTAYNSTAFEVSILFFGNKKRMTSSVFMLLWILVTMFSMITTVSVFYDRFNFNEVQISEVNKKDEASKINMELLKNKEKDIREAIDFKKKDIEYRQQKDYATSAVRKELSELEKDLQLNLVQQQEAVRDSPNSVVEVAKKESLFTFMGRLFGLEGGILEFIMSTLSAIFVNLIAPLSLTAVTELSRNKNLTK